MCLGIPGQVVEIVDPAEHLARVDVSGVRRIISIKLLSEQDVVPGDWVLVHVGFGMAKIDEAEAQMTLDQVQKMGRDYLDEMDMLKTSNIGDGISA